MTSPLALISPSLHRAGQFFRGFVTAVTPDDALAVSALLSPAELQLFLQMRPRDRRHAVRTMRHAESIAARDGAGASNDLLTAALLHDVGKGPLRVEDRVLYVLLRALSPRLLERIAQPDGARWRDALWRLRHHSEAGAAMLREAGSSARVVELTARHHHDPAPPDDAELLCLIAADERA
jgi:putative nucleotidyltransferase with HDIG domain